MDHYRATLLACGERYGAGGFGTRSKRVVCLERGLHAAVGFSTRPKRVVCLERGLHAAVGPCF